MTSKYGVPLSGDAWKGLPLRVGQFSREGKLHELVAGEDAVLVWSGGTSDVTLHTRAAQRAMRHQLRRSSGMVDLLPKQTVIEEVAWRGQASACVSVTFDAASIERMLGRRRALDPDRLRIGVTDAHVVDLVRRLQAQALAGQPWGASYVEGLCLALVSYVYGRYGGDSSPSFSADARLPALQSERLIAFVDEHLGDSDIGLTQLAALVGYSVDHFARLFKQSFGRSPHQYILERRIERSKSLLRDRGHSIAEVAGLCGFASQAHFHTAFKARTGVTPGAFRKS